MSNNAYLQELSIMRCNIRGVGLGNLLEREAGTLDGEPTIGGITVACALGWLDFRYGNDNWRNARPRLTTWYEKFLARPSMQATMPSV